MGVCRNEGFSLHQMGYSQSYLKHPLIHKFALEEKALKPKDLESPINPKNDQIHTKVHDAAGLADHNPLFHGAAHSLMLGWHYRRKAFLNSLRYCIKQRLMVRVAVVKLWVLRETRATLPT